MSILPLRGVVCFSFRLPKALPLGYGLIAPTGRCFFFVSFTQGVAIGLDMFKPFQGIPRGYLFVFFGSFDVSTDHTNRTDLFTQGVAIGLDMFKPFQGIPRGYFFVFFVSFDVSITCFEHGSHESHELGQWPFVFCLRGSHGSHGLV